MKGRIINLYQRNIDDKPHLKWIVRTPEGKIKYTVPDYDKPYFYLPANIYFSLRPKIIKLLGYEPTTQLCENKEFAYLKYLPVLQIFLTSAYDLNKINKVYRETQLWYYFHETDIPRKLRILIDNKINGYVEFGENGKYKACEPIELDYHALWLDLEMDDTHGYIDMKRILSIATTDYKGNQQFICCEKEEDTLTVLHELMKQYDYIVAFNGNTADFKWLKEAYNRNKMIINWSEWMLLDSMKLNLTFNPLLSGNFVGLDDIAEMYLGTGKIVLNQKFRWYFDNDRKKLEEYNVRDVMLDYDIDQMFNWILTAVELAVESGIYANMVTAKNKIYTSIVLREDPSLVWRGEANKEEQEIRPSFKGGYVHDPVAGLHGLTFIFDFASLYNRIMQTWGISPECYNEETGKLDDRSNPIMKRLMTKMETKRNFYKKLRDESQDQKTTEIFEAKQYSQKFNLLSGYGVQGDRRSRFFIEQNAALTTRWGRKLTIAVIKFCSLQTIDINDISVTFEGTYGDTDSVFITAKGHGVDTLTKSQMLYIANELERRINGEIERILEEENIPKEDRKIEMSLQEIDSAFFIRDKKKFYVKNKIFDGDKRVWLDPPKMEVKGFRCVKSDSTQLTRDLQRLVFYDLVNGEPIINIVNMLKKTKRAFLRGEYNSMLVITKGTKPLDQYDVETQNKQAAEKLDKLGLYLVGQKVSYVIVDKEKAKTIVEPVINNVIPEIKPAGIAHNWNNLIYTWVHSVLSEVMNPKEIDREIGKIHISKKDGSITTPAGNLMKMLKPK